MIAFHVHKKLAQRKTKKPKSNQKQNQQKLEEPQAFKMTAKCEEIADVSLIYIQKNNQTDNNRDNAFCSKVYSHHALQVHCLVNARVWRYAM